MPAPTLPELTTERDAVVAEATTLLEGLEGSVPEGETADKLRSLDTRFKELEGEIKTAQEFGGIADGFRAAANRKPEDSSKPAMYGGGESDGDGLFRAGSIGDEFLTPGELFTRSAEYAEWMKRFPGGGPAKGQAVSDSVEYPGMSSLLGFRSATARLRSGAALTPSRFRALITSDDASAGDLVRPDYRGLLEPGLIRPLTVRDLVTVIPVTTDAIEYVKENSRVSAAAPVAEATQLAHTGDETATKPEGGLTFTIVTDTVKTIAEWVPATKRILADAPALRAYIDQYLTDDLAIELEDQMISGSGGGEDFTGILNNQDIQSAGPPAGTANALDALRTARRLVVVNARTFPTAILLNPSDTEYIDVLKWGGNTPSGYVGGGPYTGPNMTTPLWGMRTIESEAVPAGTALVGDFRRAVLFDREAVTISVGTAGDDFIRNIVRVLAELRAGFGVIRPKAFCAVDLGTGS